MKDDIRKLREDDIIVCDACGSDKIAEKMWVDANSFLSVDGETYYKYDEATDNSTPQYWCNECDENAVPVHISDKKYNIK